MEDRALKLEKELVGIKEKIVEFLENETEDEVFSVESIDLIHEINEKIDSLNLDYRKLYLNKLEKSNIDTTL